MNGLTHFKAICACLREGFELLREAVAGVGAAGRCAVLGKPSLACWAFGGQFPERTSR